MCALALSSCPHHEPHTGPLADTLILDTETHTLTLYAGDVEIESFRVGLASKGEGKQVRGDRKTPIGTYRLMNGRDSKKFYRFLPVTYPNEADAARGLEDGVITQAEHDAIVKATKAGGMPPQNTKLGGAIGIHGYGKKMKLVPHNAHRALDLTAGCIMLSDKEVDRLEQMYTPGATLTIQ